jgi:hypothetical protein
MINDYLGASDAKDLEAYRNVKGPITVSEANAYMDASHHRDRWVAFMCVFSGKLQKAIRKSMQSSIVEETLDEAYHVVGRLMRIAKIGHGFSSGGGTGGPARDSESNSPDASGSDASGSDASGSDASGSDTAREVDTKASAKSVAQKLMPSHSDDAYFSGTKVGRIKWVPTRIDGLGEVPLPTVSVDIRGTRQRFFVIANSSPSGAHEGDDTFVRQTEPGKNEFIPVDPLTGRDLEDKELMIYSFSQKEAISKKGALKER